MARKAEWDAAQAAGFYQGAAEDRVDGFIHFSTQTQTAETLRLHFAGDSGLKLVRIDADKLDIVWEESRCGQLFPHLYGSMPISKVIAVYDLPLGNDSVHILPDMPLD